MEPARVDSASAADNRRPGVVPPGSRRARRARAARARPGRDARGLGERRAGARATARPRRARRGRLRAARAGPGYELGLVLRLPLVVRHAVDEFARVVLRDLLAALGGSLGVPAREAVAAETG